MLQSSSSSASLQLARRGSAFGLLAALSSSAGQTFFVGLFGEVFRADFGLTEAQLGSLYGAATLTSGLLMIWLGKLADQWALGKAMLVALCITATGSVFAALGDTWWQLGLALFLLRFGGQGLSGHFALVSAARFSGPWLGRGVAIAAMGFILGEATFPQLVTFGLAEAGRREVWLVTAAVVVVGFGPLSWLLARPLPAPVADDETLETAAATETWNRRRLLTYGPFIAALSVMLLPSFTITGVFFHQTTLGNHLDWSLAQLAQGIFLFAIFRGIFTLLIGRLVDGVGAISLIRFYLLPLVIALAAMLYLPSQAALWLAFAGMGCVAGASGVISSAIWVELFGTAQLGLIRGVYAGMMVLATAISPMLLGVLLSADVALPWIFGPIILYIVLMPPWVAGVIRRACAEQIVE